MSATNKTENYELPQFVGGDMPTWLGDYNQSMTKIDAGMAEAKEAAETAKNYAEHALDSVSEIAPLTEFRDSFYWETLVLNELPKLDTVASWYGKAQMNKGLGIFIFDFGNLRFKQKPQEPGEGELPRIDLLKIPCEMLGLSELVLPELSGYLNINQHQYTATGFGPEAGDDVTIIATEIPAMFSFKISAVIEEGNLVLYANVRDVLKFYIESEFIGQPSILISGKFYGVFNTEV